MGARVGDSCLSSYLGLAWRLKAPVRIEHYCRVKDPSVASRTLRLVGCFHKRSRQSEIIADLNILVLFIESVYQNKYIF